MSFLKNTRLFFHESGEFKDFFSTDNLQARRLVFYSEHSAYGKFFNPILEALFASQNSKFSYLASDNEDSIFRRKIDKIEVFYIKTMLGGLFQQLDSKALVMTMPDLGQFHIKRSQKGTEHIYLFHALVSTHMIYRKGAFDHYDTILCAGPHHIAEIRQTEKLYGLKPKKLIAAGYPLLDKIYTDYQSFTATRNPQPGGEEKPTVLIAPSWAPQNIMLSCFEPLAKSLVNAGFRVILRPHPEFIKRFPKALEALRKKHGFMSQVELEINPCNETSLFEADVLITDWSGIAFEYAFGTERPVLFIDTARKVFNGEYEKLGIEPIEVSLRSLLGVRIRPENADTADKAVVELIADQIKFRENILSSREKVVFNFDHSAEVIADFLSAYLR